MSTDATSIYTQVEERRAHSPNAACQREKSAQCYHLKNDSRTHCCHTPLRTRTANEVLVRPIRARAADRSDRSWCSTDREQTTHLIAVIASSRQRPPPQLQVRSAHWFKSGIALHAHRSAGVSQSDPDRPLRKPPQPHMGDGCASMPAPQTLLLLIAWGRMNGYRRGMFEHLREPKATPMRCANFGVRRLRGDPDGLICF